LGLLVHQMGIDHHVIWIGETEIERGTVIGKETEDSEKMNDDVTSIEEIVVETGTYLFIAFEISSK
jgi:hypothetical protein